VDRLKSIVHMIAKERQDFLRRLHMLDRALHALNVSHWKMSAEGRRKISRARKKNRLKKTA
jgi:hypothetical protein